MVEMFDLEWRLDEISQYAAWFAAPHTGTASDEVAFGGLMRGARASGVAPARPALTEAAIVPTRLHALIGRRSAEP